LPCLGLHKDKFNRIHYRASAELLEDGTVATLHDFLDGVGKSLPIANAHELVCMLITMNPVFRLRMPAPPATGWRRCSGVISPSIA